MPQAQVDAAVEASIKEVGLVEKANTPSGSLSGGQKRKLSVAIALIGDSKIVFLVRRLSSPPTLRHAATPATLTLELLRRRAGRADERHGPVQPSVDVEHAEEQGQGSHHHSHDTLQCVPELLPFPPRPSAPQPALTVAAWLVRVHSGRGRPAW